MIEIFAGSAVLCSIAKQGGLSGSLAIDKVRLKNARSSIMQLNLQKESDRSLLDEWLNAPNLLWVHLAPVCGAASRARDIRLYPGDPPPFRSNEEPEGLSTLSEADYKRVQLANRLFAYTMVIYRRCCTLGVLCTVENLLNSYFWITCWVLSAIAEFPMHYAEFQHCMLGGTRPKWTRIGASFPDIVQMSIACDGSHQREDWGFAYDSTGKRVWATSLESQYPRQLCVTLVGIVLNFSEQQGLKLPALDLVSDADHPLHQAQHAQIGAGLQPRPTK